MLVSITNNPLQRECKIISSLLVYILSGIVKIVGNEWCKSVDVGIILSDTVLLEI